MPYVTDESLPTEIVEFRTLLEEAMLDFNNDQRERVKSGIKKLYSHLSSLDDAETSVINLMIDLREQVAYYATVLAGLPESSHLCNCEFSLRLNLDQESAQLKHVFDELDCVVIQRCAILNSISHRSEYTNSYAEITTMLVSRDLETSINIILLLNWIVALMHTGRLDVRVQQK